MCLHIVENVDINLVASLRECNTDIFKVLDLVSGLFAYIILGNKMPHLPNPLDLKIKMVRDKGCCAGVAIWAAASVTRNSSIFLGCVLLRAFLLALNRNDMTLVVYMR